MGGLGSGGANKKRPHFEGFQRINVGYLVKHRLDRPGVYSTHSWRDNSTRPSGTMQVVGGEKFVTFVYSVRTNDGEAWQHIREQVDLERVAKPFGGTQAYFKCPHCSRRVTTLALRQRHFRCRICIGAAYASSQEGPTDRAMRRANKLKKRLGAEPGLDSWYRRPRHMRQKTFERIDARIQAAEAEVNDEHIRVMGRLLKLDASGAAKVPRQRHLSRKAFW